VPRSRKFQKLQADRDDPGRRNYAGNCAGNSTSQTKEQDRSSDWPLGRVRTMAPTTALPHFADR
jgi:hypothetical protein